MTPPPTPALALVVSFLLGEGPLDGVHFGDDHPTEKRPFWWRKHLRAALAPPDAIRAAEPVGEPSERSPAPFTLFNGEVIDLESKLPCKVTLHPGASFGKGVPIGTMLVGLLHRQQYAKQLAEDPELGSRLDALAEKLGWPGHPTKDVNLPTPPSPPAHEHGQGWRPIQSAPKGPAILVYVPSNLCTYCVSWSDGFPGDPQNPKGWRIFGGGYRAQIQDPSHWADIPPPPAGESAK